MSRHEARLAHAESAAAGSPRTGDADVARSFFGVFRYSRRAVALVWDTNRLLLFALAILPVFAGLLPASIAWVGSQIVDAVVSARSAADHNAVRVLRLVLLEGILVAAVAGAQRGLSLSQSLLRA